jgi:hypothetical protein
VHAVAPPNDIYPSGHAVSVAKVVDGQYFPAGHHVHEAYPAIAYEPGSH